MNRLAALALACAFWPAAALAQPADPHAGHHAPAPPDPHAGHQMPAAPKPATAAPPAPTDRLADRVWDPQAMARARQILNAEHGGAIPSRLLIETLEWRPASGEDGFAWEGEFRTGGDYDRLVFKSQGEGRGGKAEAAEIQALWSRALGPYYDLQLGLRQDIQPRPRRAYATLGFEGLAPYWFETEGALFLSDEGDLTARLEGSYDLRLTQRLILEPRGELNLAAQDAPDLTLGSGVTAVELGLRLRYELRREFAPYVGVHYERRLGETAARARAAGEDVESARVVLGLRAWY